MHECASSFVLEDLIHAIPKSKILQKVGRENILRERWQYVNGGLIKNSENLLN